MDSFSGSYDLGPESPSSRSALGDSPRYVLPRWPAEEFVLVAERGKFEVGPFTAESFAVGQDNSLECWPESGVHPVRLRVSMQVGDLLIANNGDMGPMTFRIVPASAYQPGGVGDLNFPTAFSTFGMTVPVGVYILKNEALGFLLGPVGMILTTALSAGWLFYSKTRKERRFQKLMQLIARISAWRDGWPPMPPGEA